MRYEHVGFNAEWVASKSVEEFIQHEKHQRLTEEQLREVHSLCVAKAKAKKKPKIEDSSL